MMAAEETGENFDLSNENDSGSGSGDEGANTSHRENEQLPFSFRAYNSLEITKRAVEKAASVDITDPRYEGEWVATEKVHGANFSFFTDGSIVKCARRKDFLREGDLFYNWPDILEKHREGVLKAYRSVRETHPDAATLIIYGELFGGSYPHASVPRDTSVSHVQKGVYYSPNVHFYAFDMSTMPGGYVNWDVAERLLLDCGFMVAQALARGTFADVLQYPNEFQTTIPALLGLPPIDGNICEGVVLKPVVTRYHRSQRIIFKNKNDHFSEVSGGKGAKPPKVKKPKAEVVAVVYPPNVEELLNIAKDYVNLNRVAAVASKETQNSLKGAKGAGRLTGLVAKDALEDFIKDHQEAYDGLAPEHAKLFGKRMNLLASTTVPQYLAENL